MQAINRTFWMLFILAMLIIVGVLAAQPLGIHTGWTIAFVLVAAALYHITTTRG